MKTMILLCLFMTGCSSLPKTPQAIAEKSKCEPWQIAHYVNYSMDYVLQPKWEDSQTCLDRQTGDCKCFAVVARDILNRCAGYEAGIVTLKDGDKRHAVAVFTDHKGQRGYIDSYLYGLYPRGTDWEVIAKDMRGNWQINKWR